MEQPLVHASLNHYHDDDTSIVVTGRRHSSNHSNGYHPINGDALASSGNGDIIQPDDIEIDTSRLCCDNLSSIAMTIFASMGFILFGYHLGFSSATEYDIANQIKLSHSQADLMWSLVSIGAMAGGLLAGPISSRFGQRSALVSAVPPFIGGAALFATTKSYIELCIGRLLCGMGVGIASAIVPMFMTEVVPAKLRGILGALLQTSIAFGVTLVSIVGLPTVSSTTYWKDMMFFSIIPAGLLLCVVFYPESPFWLASQGHSTKNIEAVRNALKRIRANRSSVQIEAELASILRATQKPAVTQDSSSTSSAWMWIKPLLIGCGAQAFQQLSGINVLHFHTQLLLTEGEKFDSHTRPSESVMLHALWGATAVHTAFWFATILSTLTMDRWGRRVSMIVSSAGMAAVLHLLGWGYHQGWSNNLMITLFAFALVFFSFGLAPVPWVLCAEIFPPSHRGLSISIATVVNWGVSFGVTATASLIGEKFGTDVLFWCYSGTCLVSMLFSIFIIPNTSGASLEHTIMM